MKTSIYKCPLCAADLNLEDGNGLDPKNGVTLSCPTVNCIDSGGHAKNEKEAWEVFQDKCGRSYGAGAKKK